MVTYVMSKGFRHGSDPSYANKNIYYDTPTNPLLVNTDTDAEDAETICYEVRNDNSIPKYGVLVATSCTSDGNFNTTHSSITVAGADPRIHFSVGQQVYNPSGTLLGTISSLTCTGSNAGTITFTDNLLSTISNTHVLQSSKGVSNCSSYNILNRIYPNTSDSQAYLENLSNTPGYRIQCYKDGAGTGERLNSIDITVNDYFVMINPDDINNHHFAKITEITSGDISGDSFEFSPKYGSEITKDTKFTIWKGPEVSDTSVVAVAYGLANSGNDYSRTDANSDGVLDNDSRHAGMTYLSKPLFYFYNDRLDKPNQLNHNTKYQIWTSWSDDGSDEEHWNACFLTCQDYGLKVKDYGPFTMNATVVDRLRDYDFINASQKSFAHYYDTTAGHIEYTSDASSWDSCFINNKRHSYNIRYGADSSIEGSFTGPTRYLHYDDSPDKCNRIPEVMEIEIFDSVTQSASYGDLVIADPMRIYGSKVNNHDKIKVKQIIHQGEISNNYDFPLPGIWNAGSGATQNDATTFTLTVEFDNDDYKPEVWLESDDGSNQYWDTFRIGNYHFRVYDVDHTRVTSGPYFVQGKTTFKVECRAWKNASDGVWNTVMTGAPAISNETAYRKAWSKSKQNLLTNLMIDTNVTYDSDPTPTTAREQVYLSKTKIYDTNGSVNNISKSKIYDTELVLTSGPQKGHSFKIHYGDSKHKVIKLQTPRLQLYRKETADDGNFLSYYSGGYVILKTIFIGEVETFKNYIEDGVLKHHIAGRNKSNKLLGPVVNKDYLHSEDIIYSTYGPFFEIEDTYANINLAAGYPINSASIAADGSTSNINQYDLLFKEDGTLIGGAANSGATPTITDKTRVSLQNNDNVYKWSKDGNLITFAKALEHNPTVTTNVSNLSGTSEKGLYFISGKKLNTDNYGTPSTENSNLAGTSAHSHKDSIGYNIYRPDGVYKSASYCKLTDEVTDPTSPSKKTIHTVNSITEYDVVEIDTKDGTTIITLAPNCPIYMGRIDENPADSRLETLTVSTINLSSDSYSKGHNKAIKLSDTYSNVNSVFPVGTSVYNSNGVFLGKVLGLESNSTSVSYITLDRPLTVALSASEYLYTSTNKTQGLYLINSQGLRNGGIIHMLDYELDANFKPTTYNHFYYDDGAVSSSSTSAAAHCLVDTYGPFMWRYYDLQREKNSMDYVKYNADGNILSHYKSVPSEFSTYAPIVRVSSGIITSPIITEYGTNNTFTNSYEKGESPETKGIFPLSGSNFADYDKWENGATNTDYTLMPRVGNYNYGGPWNYRNDGTTEFEADATEMTASNNLAGNKCNGVILCKDAFEIIDSKTVRTHLFSGGDLYPDSMTRTNHIGNIERDFSDYSIMLKSNPATQPSNVKHYKYSGSSNQEIRTDDSYELINISEGSIKTNEMRCFGLMRLTELTFDWHFNIVDAENPPKPVGSNVSPFTYSRYQKLTDSGRNISSISGSDIVCDSSTNLAARFPVGSYVYGSSGHYLGTVSSVSSATITCSSAVRKVYGADPTGDLYYMEKGHPKNYSYLNFNIGGRDGDSSFVNFSKESADNSSDSNSWTTWRNSPRPLHMLQGAVFNGYGSTKDSDGALDAEDYLSPGTNNEGYGYNEDTAFKNYFVRKMDFASKGRHTRGYLNHLSLPPVLEGIQLQKLYKAGSSGTRLYLNTHSSHEETAGSSGETYDWGSGAVSLNGRVLYTNAANSSDISNQLTAGDRIYSDNGVFIGTYYTNLSHDDIHGTGQTYRCIIIYESIVDTVYRLYKSANATTGTAGTRLCKGVDTDIMTMTGTLTSGSNTVTVTDNSNIQYGMKVSGTGIPSNTRVSTTPGSTEFTMSNNASSSGSGVTITFSKALGKGAKHTNNDSHALAPKEQLGWFCNNNISSSIPDTEFIHPSKVLQAIADFKLIGASGATTGWWTPRDTHSPYHLMRFTSLNRYSIEQSMSNDNYKITLDKGMGFPLNSLGVTSMLSETSYDNLVSSIDYKIGSNNEESRKDILPFLLNIRLMDLATNSHQNYTNGTSSGSMTTTNYLRQDLRGEFGKWKINREDGYKYEKNRGTSDGNNTICDGSFFVLRPIFTANTSEATIDKLTGSTSPHGRTSHYSERYRMRFNLTNPNDNPMNWIRFVDLTGCYLVSDKGYSDAESVYSGGSSTDTYSQRSAANIIPEDICYIKSHDWDRDSGSSFYHVIDIIGNFDTSEYYRVMRPNQVCLYPNSPSEINLYELHSKYTKQGYSDEMYSRIGNFRFAEENEYRYNAYDEPDNEEGVLSMYVIVNPHHLNSDMTRHTNIVSTESSITGSHTSDLFGDGGVIPYGSYNFLISDGINKIQSQVEIRNSSFSAQSHSSGRTNTLVISKQLEKLSGVVSFGETFTVKTATPVNLKNPSTASIGTGVKIGYDAEDIINDVMEDNDITYTRTDKEKLYITTPNIQGSDLYNTVDYLAKLKNKDISIVNDIIELTPKDYEFKFTGLEINENDSDVKVIEIEQNSSAFDFYNEVILYSSNNKSIKRNSKSIMEIGKKTYEEFDNNISTQEELDKRATELLQLYSINEKRVTITCINNSLELIRAGDIITIDYPSENIPRNNYIVLEIRYDSLSRLTLECGGYSKTLDNHLANLIISNKNIAAFLRKDRFKSSTVDDIYYDSLRLKPIKLSMTRQVTQGNTTVGLNTEAGVDTTQAIGNLTNEDVLWEEYK